jgi:hypothetical protein
VIWKLPNLFLNTVDWLFDLEENATTTITAQRLFVEHSEQEITPAITTISRFL